MSQIATPGDLKIIRHAPLFSALSTEALSNLISDSTVQTHERGHALFTQGEHASAFFVVLSGWIKVFRLTSNGTEAVIGIFTQGQNFAEAAAFTGGVYPASGEAVTDARVLRIPARRLFERISASPEIGLAMLASTSQHLHLLVRQIETLKAHTGAQRIAEFLLELAPAGEDHCLVDLPYDKALIAARLGMKPESLSRAFNRLKEYGVEVIQRQADIQSLQRLRDFSESERAEIMRAHTESD
jgi:CRP-like cAMP-binding protein